MWEKSILHYQLISVWVSGGMFPSLPQLEVLIKVLPLARRICKFTWGCRVFKKYPAERKEPFLRYFEMSWSLIISSKPKEEVNTEIGRTVTLIPFLFHNPHLGLLHLWATPHTNSSVPSPRLLIAWAHSTGLFPVLCAWFGYSKPLSSFEGSHQCSPASLPTPQGGYTGHPWVPPS